MSEQKKPWEQNWNQPTAINTDSTNKKPWEQNWSEEKTDQPKEKGILGHLKDTGLSALKGAIAVPELAVGVMDMMSDGAVGKTLENKDGAIGFRPKEAKQALGDLHTDQYKAQQQEFADAGKDGNWVDKVVDKTKVALTNPSLIANTVVESVPSMLAGGVLGRASGIANPVVAGAVGEGTVMAGSQAEQIRQETVDGRLTADQSLAGATTGILGGLIGFAGGRLAQKMGIGDVDTMLVTGRAGPAEIAGEIASMPAKSLPRRVVEGAISEGFLEELPQSVSEQILQNLALDKPWNDGIEDAAVMGTLAGMAMGGAANILSGHNTGTESQDNQQQSGSPNLPSAPSQLGSSPDSALAGEYIPRENVPQGDNQGRTAFVYDQPSMDADNLLNNNYKGDTGFDTSGNFGPSNNPDSPLSPSGGNYFDDPVNQPQPQLPSERLGINPNDGPMSSAAALAVDSGASPVTQLSFTPEQQDGNSPLSDAVPSNYQSLLGSQNDGQPFDARFEDAKVQQGNAQADNAGKSISQQYDTNAADAMGGAIETDTAQTVQPILGQDGKNKWFGTQEKAQAFIDKKDLGNDYQVVQDGKRFEIQPKAKSPVQDDAYFQSKLDDLDKQRAAFEVVGDDANATKLYDEMQKVSREWQVASAKNQPNTNETPQKEYHETESDKAWSEYYRTNRNMIGDDLFEGGHNDKNELKNAPKEIQSRSAHGMSKSTPATAVADLKKLLNDGIDPNRGGGRLFTAPLNNVVANEEERRAASMSGTSSGSSYGDGAFTLVAKQGIGDISNISEVEAVMVNSSVPKAVVDGLRQDFPDMKFGYANEMSALLSGGKQSNDAKSEIADLEQQIANEKSVPEKAQIRKQITELQNGLADQAQGDVPNPLSQDDKNGTPDTDQVAVNTAPKIEDLVSVTTTDGETHMVLASELNDSNVKNLTKFSAQGKRVAVKLPRGRIASTSEQNKQERPTSATEKSSDNKFQKYDDVAKQYGRSVNSDGAILSNKGKDTGVRIKQLKGRVRIEQADGKLLHSGSNPESLGKFLEDYWYDKKIEPKQEANNQQVNEAPKAEQPKVEATKTEATEVNQTESHLQENEVTHIQDKRSDSKESIQDLGEKIGGARKDTALSTGKSKKTKSNDDRPTWAKRYTISEIVSSTNSNETGKWVIEDSKKTDWKGSPKKLGMFDSEQEAKDMLPVVAVGLKHRVYARRDGESGFEIWRQINDVKRVKVVNKVFDTKQDAQTYLIENANNILETSTTFGELDLPRPENTVRKGIERRKGDAKDTDFMKVFGFRGVEFGNWNNQEERQQLLNDAYDGLLDLAEVLKIPAKAISLNGDLALAFGARGQGLSSARAHYEPAKVVINLTKMNGAGSLAHEWWHAFDHYLARQDGIASAEWVVDADGTRSLKISNSSKDRMVSHGFSYRNSGVREDVRNAYTDLMKTMSTKAEQYVEDVQAVDKFVGQSRDRVKEQLDSLREDLSQQRDPKYYKRHNKPASAEQLVLFDTISQKLINGELLETEWRTDVKNKSAHGIFSGARWTNDALEQLGEIYKSVRGRSGFSKDQDAVLDRLRSAMDSYANRLKMLADAQKAVSKTRKIPTKFVMDAKNLDEGRGSDYWTTPHELSARAFQGFVEDKIAENNGRSPFLNHAPENAAIETPWGWVRPYPHGDERKAINAKFYDLVDTLKTEETETGIKLYSRDKLKPDNERRGASPLDTTFTPLSVVSATRRVLSILEHLKIVTTQIDASVRGRIVVGWQRVGVNKVKGLDSHSFTVQVVESFDGLPSAIQEDNRYQGENGETKRYDVLGVWHNGTLYINAGDIQGNNSTQQTTFEMYEELILHEVVGHFGVQQIFGREYKTKLQQLFNALGGLEGIRKIAKDNGVDMQQFNDVYINPRMQAVKDEIYTESDVQQSLVGELFAFVAQNAKSRPFVRQKLKEVIGYIRQWFRDRGFDKFLSRYNDADLMMFLSEARKAVVDRSYFGKYKNQEFSSKNNSDTPLYSRRTKSNSGSTTQQVRDVLIDRFGKETIDELERQGKLEIIQDYQVEGVEGFYYNGKAVLVASNLTDESTVPTFLHELGGHAGFQNMMNQKQYNELMNQFNKLVEQGNPVALAAKMLAEREQGSERQQLEYLPYLLTLSSTMQQRNVLQRNALQRLIQNIVTYVKAWVFDRFGVNLNLNPDDMLALSERMIEKFSYHSDAAINQHGVAKYSLNENSHAPFQKAIDDVVAGNTQDRYFNMGATPDVLKMLGLPDTKVTINGKTIEKVMAQYLGISKGIHSNIHNLTPDTLRQLPKQINDPVAVFTSGNDASRQGYVVLTELTEKDVITGKYKPVIAALHLNKTRNGVELINIASMYGRSNKQLQKALNDDLLYWHKEKGQRLVDTNGLQLPQELHNNADQTKGSQSNVGSLQLQPETHSNASLSNANIKTNEDLVKYQEQPLYSRSSNYDDITNRIANGFKSLPKIGDWINDKGVDWLKIGLGLLSRRHLTEVYGKLLPQLNKYNELAAQMDADKNDIAAEADNIVREWSKLKDEEALANVMHEATLAQIDPAKPYQQGDNKVKYQQLHKAYNALSPEAQAMYKKARNAYSGHYAKVREAIRERILRSALSSQKKADLLQKIEGSFGQIKGVYFPLARFGKYVVVMRNQNGQAEVVSRAETYSEAKSIRSELMLKYPQFKADDVEQDAEFNASRDSVGRGFMSDLFDEVGNLGLDAKAQAEFEDTLSQLYLSSMPDLSWAKHGIHRKGTAGFSNDARRAFAQHMFSGANYLGKLRYGDQLAQQLDEMKKYSKEQFNKGVGYDQRSARSVIDEMEKRHELLMNPKGNPLSSFLTSVGFMYYMGLSPAAAMVNLSQTALIAYPIMGAKWGFDKAGKELLKASSDFAKGVEFNVPDFSSLENFKNSIGDVYSPNIDKVIKGLELDAYNKAVSRGVIDVTQAHDLAGIAQGEDSKVMWYFRPAMRLASGMFHHAERFNREVTFIAAYRLATQAGANHDTAFEQAMEAVYKGHFDYSTGNRARFLQGPVAKVLFLFKQYAQNMLYTLVRNAHQSLYALEPSERTEARRALAGILGMHALAAGAIGLPITGMLATASLLIAKKSKLGAAAFGAAALAAFFGAADGDDDDPYELEIVIRNWLADIHPKFADLVFGGVPRVFSPVDLSGRVGLSNLIIPDVQEGLEGADWATAMQSALLGPVVGISTSTAKGLQQIQEGDYGRGIETMLPIFLKNAMKSYRYADEGVLTKNKDVIHDKDVTGVELFSQAIGFSPASVRTSYEGRSAIFQYRTKLEDHRRELMRKWVVARQEDDSDGMNKVWTEILEFNEKTAEKNPKMRISRMNLMQSYKATERKAKETGDGGVYLTKRQKGAEEQGGFAFNR